MPHNRKRASLQPRFLIESPTANVPPFNGKIKSRLSSKKLPIDMQIFRIMGNTVANSAQDYPLVFPEFVSRFIAAGNDEPDGGDVKKQSWKIIAEMSGTIKNQQSFEEIVESTQGGLGDGMNDKRSLRLTESSSCNSLSGSVNSPVADHRSAQMIAFVQSKVTGGAKKLMTRSVSTKDNSLSPSLAVGGRSISRPNTPGVPVPFVRGITNSRSNSISAAAAPTSKSLNAPIYAQLLNPASSVASNMAITHNNGSVIQKSGNESPQRLSGFPSNSSGSLDQMASTSMTATSGNNLSANTGNGPRTNNISAVAAIAFSRNTRGANNNTPRVNSVTSKAPAPSVPTQPFASSKYADPLYGITSSNSLFNELYRRRISEITMFQEQTIRFEQRKANQQRVGVHRSVNGVSVQNNSSSINGLVGFAQSPSNTPIGKMFQRVISPIEQRSSSRNKDVDEDHSSNGSDDEEDDEDTS